MIITSVILCEAYKVGWDFVIIIEQQQQTSNKSAASHTGKNPSCLVLYYLFHKPLTVLHTLPGPEPVINFIIYVTH